ncbi:cupin domain-containing protein, partial [Arthrobacter sp. SIMBA_036]
VEPEHTELLASLLPDLLYLRSSDEEAGRLTRIVELIGEESLCQLAGRELVMGRLVEIMLVEVLRRPMLQIEGQRTGWLS